MRVATGNSHVAELLKNHPRVSEVIHRPEVAGLRIEAPTRVRNVYVGDPTVVQYGLLELMDNNPLVCADDVSIPSLSASLCLIALGPVLLSGQVVEAPTLIENLEFNEEEISVALGTVGWHDGGTLSTEPNTNQTVAMAGGMAVIPTLADPEELGEIYLERYGKTSIIQLASTEEWAPEMVSGLAKAVYKIGLTPDDPTSLVSVRVMCDQTGKFQAAQIVNAMNIMCGFEDELGITS